MIEPLPPSTTSTAIPPEWGPKLSAALLSGETLICWLEVDLDAKLHYGKTLLAFTERRFLAIPAAAVDADPLAWYRDELQSISCRDQFGLGMLDLTSSTARLGIWRFTSRHTTAAHRFAQRVAAALRNENLADKDTVTVCPSCGTTLGPEDVTCVNCAPMAQLPPSKSLLRLLPFARRRGGMLAAGLVLTIAATAATLIPPYLTMPLVDDVLTPYARGEKPEQSLVVWYLSGLLIAALLAWLLGWAKTWIVARLSSRIAADLRNAMYSHLQKLSLEFFGGKRTGDLISRVGSDTDKICTFLSIYLLEFASDLLMIIGTSIILFSTDVKLALVTLVPFPIIAYLIQKVRKQMRHGFNQENRTWSNMISVLSDTIPGIRVVKAFAQEQREVERFRTANDHVLESNDRVNRVWAFFGPVVSLLTDAGILVVWAFGVYQISQGQLRTGVLIGFLAYIGRFYTRLDAMSRMFSNSQRAAAASHRIFEILDRIPSVAEPVKPISPGRVEGKIEIRDIRFSYGSRQVINDVNLSIEPGEMIGLVGASGAGKSTLVNLVCRFYDVASGAILVDGVDIRSFPVEEYRRNIGIVLQEPFLFFGSIAENIAYAKPEATRAQIIAAAKAAKAHDFILRLPDGYDSIVGERGQSLSGGERQRISIARALLTDPRILILDEATSSVDTETEREIQEALDVLTKGRTTIAIAHRLSTLRNASRIVVMEQGRVMEVGGHGELLDRNGAYAKLHQAQYELTQGVVSP
ncbi:ABC transporter ATP-binding protein [Anatilimnocola sp. NA78]|uniref:cyanophycin metabolism-associated ABC transporter n=1 Tax=Anatilimnocola sp. NA78 TaxID=3415683 RepID=UPI003CE47F38